MENDDIIISLRRFKETNQHKYNIIKIGLFGSAVRERMSEQSDIDVVVELETEDLFDLIGIKLDLEEQLSQQVDIVSYREKKNDFHYYQRSLIFHITRLFRISLDSTSISIYFSLQRSRAVLTLEHENGNFNKSLSIPVNE